MKICRVLLRVFLALAATTAIIGIASFAAASPLGTNGDNGCHANVQNPHISDSHGGIDVTATWYCTTAPVDIYLLTPGGLALWNCQNSPQRSLSWLEANCEINGYNQENPVSLPTANKSAFRTAPPLSDPAACGQGYWIASAIWQSHGPNGTGAKTTDIGNGVPINDPCLHHKNRGHGNHQTS